MPERFSSISQKRMRYSPTKSNSSGKPIFVILFVAVTVVGLIWILRSGGSDDGQVTGEQTQEETQEYDYSEFSEEEPEEVIEVDVTEKTSDDSAEGVPGVFTTDSQHVGEDGTTGTTVGKLTHEAYEGFFRIVFEISSDELPYTTAHLESGSNLVSLKFNGIDDDQSGLKAGNALSVSGSVVSTVFHNITSEEHVSLFSIGIKESTGFSLHTLEDPLRVVLDIEEKEVEEGATEEFSFSKDPQSVEGDASGNVITIQGVSHSNQGSEYRVIFRLGTVGSGNIPTAQAGIVDYEGGKAIKVVISDLYDDYIGKQTYNAEYGDSVVTGGYGEYSDHSSTYYLKISSEKEFKLHYLSAPAQLMVDVKR